AHRLAPLLHTGSAASMGGQPNQNQFGTIRVTVMETRWAFGDLLKRHRLTTGLTHEGLAERSALSARTISDLERGVSRRPRRETVDLLSQALQLSPAERSALEGAAWPGTRALPASSTPGHG